MTTCGPKTFFSTPAGEKRFLFTWDGQQYTFAVLPQGWGHHPPLPDMIQCKGVWTILQNITRVLFVDDIMSTRPAEQEVVWEASVKHIYSRGLKVKPYKDSVPRPHQQTLQGSVVSGMPGHLLESKGHIIASHFLPYEEEFGT